MKTADDDRDPPPVRPKAVELAIAAGHLLALAALLQVIERLIGQNPLAYALAGAVAAELVSGRVGVRWTLGLGEPSFSAAARLCARGCLPVAIAVALAVVVGRAIGWADVAIGHPGVSLGFALVRALAIGVRDELLYRGIPLAAASRVGMSRPVALAFATLTGVAALALSPSVTPAAITLELAAGLSFALLWQFGTLAGVAAHGAWAFLIGAGLHGGLLDVGWTRGALVSGAHAEGPPAVLGGVALLACAAAAVLLAQRRAGLAPS